MYEQTLQMTSDTPDQRELLEASPLVSLDPDVLMEQVLCHLDRATRCSASGFLLLDGQHGHLTLYRSRPVDDLFLRALQQRMLSIYCVCVGPAAVEPDIALTVLGDAVSGPYEPPRSVLSTPILCEGRVSGVLAVASVFPEAFSSRDLCTLSVVAAQASAVLSGTCPDKHSLRLNSRPAASRGPAPGGEPFAPQGKMWRQVSGHLASICDLAAHWQVEGNRDVPEALVRDLSSIAENARQIRELLTY